MKKGVDKGKHPRYYIEAVADTDNFTREFERAFTGNESSMYIDN